MKLPAPKSVTIEFVEGCNEACFYCGIKSIRERPNVRTLKFMTRETLEDFILQMESIPQWRTTDVIISGRGEPTLHPEFLEFVYELSYRLTTSRVILETNGQSLVHKTHSYEEFREAGINLVSVHADSSATQKQKNAKKMTILNAMERGVAAPYTGELGHLDVNGFVTHQVKVDRQSFINAGGLAGPKAKQVYPCHIPFDGFTIRYDGAIALCPHDFAGEARFETNNYLTHWNSRVMNAVRISHLKVDPKFNPCAECNGASKEAGDFVEWSINLQKYEKGYQSSAATVNEYPARNSNEVVQRDWDMIVESKAILEKGLENGEKW